MEGAAERPVLRKADLLDYDALRAAIDVCHGIFHTASPVTDNPITGVDGRAGGEKDGVRRVVFTSTVGAVTMDPNRGTDVVGDESCWSDLEFWLQRVFIADSG